MLFLCWRWCDGSSPQIDSYFWFSVRRSISTSTSWGMRGTDERVRKEERKGREVGDICPELMLMFDGVRQGRWR
jgi:hypothetical protein